MSPLPTLRSKFRIVTKAELFVGVPQSDSVQAWASRWLLRWHRASGRSSIDTTGALQLDHQPPIHVSARKRDETAAMIAASLLSELQGTVGGRRAVTALVADRQANAVAYRSDPDTALVAAARDWLNAYRDAGGSWIGTDERPQLVVTPGADLPTLRRMQDDLFADATLARAVRWQIVTEWRSAYALSVADLEGC